VFPPDDAPGSRYRVHICFGPNCTPKGSQKLLPLFREALKSAGIEHEIELIATSCRDRCEFGPSVNVYPGPTFYAHIDEAAVNAIVNEHLVGGRPVERYRFRGHGIAAGAARKPNAPFSRSSLPERKHRP